MKRKDENAIRQQARATTKIITDLGAPWGPDEAFVSGYKKAEADMADTFDQMEAEIADLRKKIAKHDTQ